jgi:hypothetical protein
MRCVSFAAVGRRVALLASMIALGACAANVADYAGEAPRLDLTEFFHGPIQAWGIVQNRSGKVVRRFQVDMVGRWVGNEGVLEEDFRFADGQTQRRIWRFRKIDASRYSGTAGDVTGQAEGEVAGFALRWRYVLQVEVDGKTWDIDFDDWMYLLDDRTMINRSVMRKFGLRVGEVTLFFRKPPVPPEEGRPS